MTHKENVPKWVRQRFAATIQYMNEKGTSWIFKKLQDSDEVYYIQYTQNRKIGYKLSEKQYIGILMLFLKIQMEQLSFRQQYLPTKVGMRSSMMNTEKKSIKS